MRMNKLNLPISSLILAFVPWCYALLAEILPRPIVPVVAILSYLSLTSISCDDNRSFQEILRKNK
ncbi:MAG: hypothetical protein FVQ79_08820 [Planctomycetes bacterium]|nr:hypothetical protein [Planctomycetota bacterium]